MVHPDAEKRKDAATVLDLLMVMVAKINDRKLPYLFDCLTTSWINNNEVLKIQHEVKKDRGRNAANGLI
jgi:hypothetical protein